MLGRIIIPVYQKSSNLWLVLIRRYDLLVNGGVSITLTYQRASFLFNKITVYAPWNDFVIAPVVLMRTPSQPNDPNPETGSRMCDLSRLPQPSAYVLTSQVRAYTDTECTERGPVIPEMQVSVQMQVILW